MNKATKGETQPNPEIQQSYKFHSLRKNDVQVFEFITNFGLKYEVSFEHYSTLFNEYREITCPIYSSTIEVVEGNPTMSPVDKKVGATIANIFKVFLTQPNKVIVYVCDSVDNRQLARKRKFDSWFNRYNTGSFLKQNNIAVIDNKRIYSSLIFHKQHEQRLLLITAFEEVNRWAEQVEK